MKTSMSKKEIRNNLEAALINEIEKMEGSEFSKKIKRVVRKVSKGIAVKVKLDMKKKVRKADKKIKNDKKRERKSFVAEAMEHVENGHS